MRPAEVWAVEIRQYIGGDVKTLVPSVIRAVKRDSAASQPQEPFQWRRRDVALSSIEGLAERLNQIPGIAISPESLTKRPTFDMLLLQNQVSRNLFYHAIGWFHSQIESGATAKT